LGVPGTNGLDNDNLAFYPIYLIDDFMNMFDKKKSDDKDLFK